MAIGFESRPVSAGNDADRPDLASVSGARHTEWIPAGIAPTDYQPWWWVSWAVRRASRDVARGPIEDIVEEIQRKIKFSGD
jgi:hypothetical protein